MRAILSLTVAGSKRLIAKAVARMPEVQSAREKGKILLMAGTTVSAVAEELVGVPLRLSGRVTPRGLKGAQVTCNAPHNMLIEGSGWRNVDSCLSDTISHLAGTDLVIVGANIIDANGGAAIMGGGPRGGTKGPYLTSIMAEGIPIIIPVGLEKLIPGVVGQAVRAAGRRWADRSMGVAVGLMPIFGQLVTEVEAVKLLAAVDCRVIGKGGVDGAEGGVTLAISGEGAHVESLYRLALLLRDATTSGAPESREECFGPHYWCHIHKACMYKSPKLVQWYLENGRSKALNRPARGREEGFA